MKKFTLIAMLCAVGMIAMAKPAYRGPIVRTMEDGTEKIVYLHGNEDFHYMTDATGAWLDEATLTPMSEARKNERLQAKAQAGVRRAPQATQGVGDKPNIAPRGLVILVNFQDKAFVTPKDTLDAMLNSETFTRDYSYVYSRTTIEVHSEGSAKRYFEDQSYGAYSPIFDVVGPVTMSRNMSYYGGNDSGGNDLRPDEMIIEACDSVNEIYGIDFTQYDNDNDGLVDFVYVIYAGFGEADGGGASTIWPHQWNLYEYGGIRHEIDGKILNRYACGNELSYGSKLYDGIGTICHEFSHVLGLPDFYVTQSLSNPPHTLCDWDIMDYGPYNNDGNTPPAYSAYERFYMGWLTPRVLDSLPQFVCLEPINLEKGDAVLLCDGGEHNMVGWSPSPKNFYLLEARTQDGWDEYLPGEGMLITKIQYSYNKWSSNTVNNTASKMGVDILEAQTNTSLYGKYTDAYPAGKRSWTTDAKHEVTAIEIREGGAVCFSYNGGTEEEGVETVPSDQVPGTKVMENGVLYLIYKGAKYNVQGVRVE